MDPHAAFQVLQPASICVARDQNVESVRALCHAVEEILATEKDLQIDSNSSCINDLKKYLIFPLFIILKSEKKCSWTLQEEMVRCMFLILRQSCIDDFNFFQEIFSRLFILLTNKDDPRKGSVLSEECKQLTLTTVITLIHNSSDSVLDKVYNNAFRPQLGHAVFVCMKFAQEEKNRGLRIEAIESLLSMGQCKKFTTLSEKQQAVLSSTFINFLPGIVTGLAKIVTGDEKQGHKVTSVAIDAWTYFVVLVMRDDFLEVKVSRLEESETVSQLRSKLFKEDNLHKAKERSKKVENKFYIPEPDEDDLSPKLTSIEIDRKWIHETAEKLVLLIQSITKLVSHTHWKVRLSLIHLAQELICKCHKSISGAVLLAVQVIVTLRSDDIVDVGSAAQNSLLTVMNVIGCFGHGSQVQKGLYELLEEHIYALCTQLPTTFKQQDDTKTLSSVRQLLGCLEVLGDRIVQLMTWPSHSLRLLRSIQFALTVDVTDSDLLLEKTGVEDPFSILNLKPSLGRNFKYFQDIRVFEGLVTSCKLIGYHSDLTVVSDICLELLQETQPRKETYIMFTLIIQGRDRKNGNDKDRSCVPLEESEKVVQNILDVIMNQGVFDVPLYVTTSTATDQDDDEPSIDALIPVNKQQNISIDVVKNNVVLVSNTLNLISATAQMLGKQFEMFLSNILCSVMEKAGDSNVLVGYSARNTLGEIAQACEFESIEKLIENSVPHYWYSLSLKLKRLLQYPSAPLVLQVCLEYASVDVIAFTEELVQDVLVCLDTYHNDQALPLLRVLLVYVMAVIRYESKRISVEEGPNENMNEDSCHNERKEEGVEVSSKSDLASFISEYHKKRVEVKQALKQEESRMEDDVKEGDAIQGNNDEPLMDEESKSEESKNEVPVYVRHVVEIIEKCSHMLYFKDRKLKLLILEIIKAGSEALAKWENERLPVFHKLWKPLVLRLKDEDFIVMMRSYEALTVMAVSSGDFLRRRILKEIFPVIFCFLKNQSHVSCKKTRKSGYYMTTAYRAQCTLLKHLPTLGAVLDLGVLEMGELLDVSMMYLDCRQPQQLLNFGMDIVKQLSISHPQYVWLSLAYHQPSVRIVPRVSSLPTVKIKTSAAGHLPAVASDLFRQLS